MRSGASVRDPFNWDERVSAWEEVAATPAFQGLQQRVLREARPTPSDIALDLGAGTGLLTIPLARQVSEVIAVDISSAMLARLRQRADESQVTNLTCIEADLRVLPLDDDSVTLAVSNYTFHHLADAEKELALAEVRRILAPGGRLVVCDMMFALSLAPRDRRVIIDKLTAIGRRGPGGWLRIARNAGRVAAGRWEQPAPADVWEQMLARRRFSDIRVELVEQEAGLACATRPSSDGHIPVPHQ